MNEVDLKLKSDPTNLKGGGWSPASTPTQRAAPLFPGWPSQPPGGAAASGRIPLYSKSNTHTHTKNTPEGYTQTHTQLKNHCFLFLVGKRNITAVIPAQQNVKPWQGVTSLGFGDRLCTSKKYMEPGLWTHKLAAWERGTDCSWVMKHVPFGRAGPRSHLCQTTNAACPEPSDTHNPNAYLFGNAECAKAVCGVQVQVVLCPAENLFLTFSFGVALKKIKIKRQQQKELVRI